MTKVRTLGHLQDCLDKDFGWRLKELADLKDMVRKADGTKQKTAIRSAICLAYAHWEGFVKKAAENYITFVSDQRLPFEKLSDCFVAIGAKRHLSTLSSDVAGVNTIEAVRFFRHNLSDRAYLKLPGAVKTRANLSSTVFEDIAVTIGLSTRQFSTRYNQIDETLLARRNSIAHGEYLDLGAEPCRDLIDDVIHLLRAFKTEIENAASEKAYRTPIT